MRHLLWIVTAMVASVAALALAAGDWRHAAAIFAVGWAWLFGVNYLTAMFKFPGRLKRALREDD